ncbi:MAG: LysE family transporter [Bacteroidota bacterium]
MGILFNGILMGLALSILVGPLLFALVQTGIEKGIRAGFALGTGIWLSDFLFIFSVYWGISHVVEISEMEYFDFYLGGIGGIILIVIGIATMLTRPPVITERPTRIKGASYLALALKGFAINTFNPFTVLFWISMMSTVVLKDGFSGAQTILFFGGIMGTVIFFDTLKVVLAKVIRRKLKPLYILRMRQISGAALLIFGIVLMVSVLL